MLDIVPADAYRFIDIYINKIYIYIYILSIKQMKKNLMNKV